MKPEGNAKRLLAITRTKAKMFEYEIPEEDHIRIEEDPSLLFDLTIGILGDVCSGVQNENDVAEQRSRLLFSAHYFDAFQNSKFSEFLSDYTKLLAGSAYYLCGFPGSSRVLIDAIGNVEANADGLEWLLWALLKNDFSDLALDHFSGKYEDSLKRIHHSIGNFIRKGQGEEAAISLVEHLRRQACKDGGDRELLLADIARSICRRKLEISSWNALPKYSGIPIALWRPFLQKPTSIQELWPAQLLLAEHGVLKGRSAIVQMPTSAGKTKAAELIIRSAFLSGRTKLAVIVAPYRALCHEIYDDLLIQFAEDEISLDLASDVLQADVVSFDYPGARILILTPEKLEYLLRHIPEIADKTGLIIYDEGHLFDDSSRGVVYELLLASLKRQFTASVQVVLISAVISNVDEIGEWLTGDKSDCVSGRDLHPTYRTVAFASWLDRLGRLEFVDPETLEKPSFFVPRIIESHELKLRPNESKERVFPEKKDPGHIALYLGCKLVHNGAVAVFAGRKDSAGRMANVIVDAFGRDFLLTQPSAFCDRDELKRLVKLYELNLGKNCIQTAAAQLGIFLHHANTPQGIRLAIEYALQNDLIRFVICTSTLGQGVNLPLRYLIVTTDRQGRTRIRNRDFHNLMGRVGRAGIYTEGTVIFANPDIFDKRMNPVERWRWDEAMKLLDPENSEPCKSHILTLFEPLKNIWNEEVVTVDPIELATMFHEAKNEFDMLPKQIAQRISLEPYLKDNEIRIAEQLYERKDILKSISVFLIQLTIETEDDEGKLKTSSIELLRESLAYYQANDEQKHVLEKLFDYLENRIFRIEPSLERRKAFSKTILDPIDCQELMKFVESILPKIAADLEIEEIFCLIWPVLYRYSSNKAILSCSDKEALKSAAIDWLKGIEYRSIYGHFTKVRFGRRLPTMEHVVDICENGFGYEGSLIVGSCVELLDLMEVDELIKKRLRHLQKALKYGLPTESAIIINELGLTDRTLARVIDEMVKSTHISRQRMIRSIKRKAKDAQDMISQYPSYFQFKLDEILAMN